MSTEANSSGRGPYPRGVVFLVAVVIVGGLAGGGMALGRRFASAPAGDAAVVTERTDQAPKAAFPGPAKATAGPAVTVPAHVPPRGTFAESACPVAPPSVEGVTLRCGWLTVPVRRDLADSGTIDLAVGILSRAGEGARPDPILFLEGGPGAGVLDNAEFWANAPLLGTRDIVLIDQRGTGHSGPQLVCPELDLGAGTADIRRCRERLAAEGADLAALRTLESAGDIADLRLALGYAEWNLWGSSYGTRVALTVLRHDPTGVRSVVLEAPYPPHVDAFAESPIHEITTLNTLFERCAQAPECEAAYPRLKQRFTRLVIALDIEPVELPAPRSGGEAVELDGYTLAGMVLRAQRSTWLLPLLPGWIHDLAEGRFEPLEDREERLLGEGRRAVAVAPVTTAGGALGRQTQPHPAGNDVVFYSIECAEEIAYSELRGMKRVPLEALLYERSMGAVGSARDLVVWSVQDMLDACEVWDVADAGPEANTQVESDVPALVLVGDMDPVTPPSWASETTAGLSRGHAFLFPGFAHEVVHVHPCPHAMMAAFLDDPTTPPSDGCISEIGFPFLLP